MFIKENSTVDIILFYKKVGMHYLAFNEMKFKQEELTDEEKEQFKKLTVKMKQLTWGLYNDLQENSVDIDQQGNNQFNYRKYKELRLIKLIKSWDAKTKDSEGNEIPVKVNEKTIKSLAPEIAESILNAYDEMMFLSEEEEKK
jgi:hypothetical protein